MGLQRKIKFNKDRWILKIGTLFAEEIMENHRKD